MLILGMDLPNIDLLVGLDALPEADAGCHVRRMGWQSGGKVATGLCAASALGVPTALLGAVGDDLYGRAVRRNLAHFGVDDIVLVTQTGRRTGMSVILSDRASGGRRILHQPGTATLELSEAGRARIPQAAALYVRRLGQAELEAARIARASGIPVVIDMERGDPTVLEHLDLITSLIGSETCYRDTFPGAERRDVERHARSLTEQGPRDVLFTFGAGGVAGVADGRYHEQAAFPVTVEDTVGAGDVFHGVWFALRMEGADPETCSRYAAAAAAIKCTRPGGTGGIPDRPTLEHFLRTGQIDYARIDERCAWYAANSLLG
ncbi:MAG: carbohydrate kinase family protein [Bacillota bacterium]|nr:carbohydrate kinase family protein [Bacillota bacterium]